MTASLAAIHVAKKTLGLDDDTYRAKLHLITGKTSARDLTEGERERVLAEFRRNGWRPEARRADGRQKLTGKYAAKLQALWIAAYNLGIVRNRDDAALVAFVKRQTGIDHVRFLSSGPDAARAIEAMKSWLTREAAVDWGQRAGVMPYQNEAWYRVIQAQWRILTGTSDRIALSIEIERILGCTALGRNLDGKSAQRVMNTLGRRIRAAKEAT